MKRLGVLTLVVVAVLAVAAPAHAGTVLITGTRDGQRVVVSGTVGGFGPAVTFVPLYRLDGGVERVGIPFTSQGTFTWQRKTRKQVEVRVEAQDPFDPFNPVVSNTVTIPACVRYVCP